MAFETQRLTMPVAPSAGTARRDRLFRESFLETMERWGLGTAWALMPSRIGGLPALMRMAFDEFMAPDYALPDPERALDNPLGLAGIVHDLSLPTLLSAYRRGLYPFAHLGPLKWWSPPTRSLLFFEEFHVAKRLRRQMRQGRYTVTFDRDFEGVIKACAGARTGRWHVTWITPRIMHAFAQAFDAGHAHSFEVWNERGDLVGGGYGLAVGNSFVTESQFSKESNTSKIGFTVLNWHLARWGFAFNDGKLMTPTTRDMGFREVPRREYLGRLTQAERKPERIGRWQVEADMITIADWQPQK
ncbi:leucyl/phenylalanyl-tRNA--protein transferase [Pseudolabrys taiwanensis]|uniref:Leucyl/phenylalanyl-tRNA--protein transferase n=1 Tax=Pseudolabrys taiwanensis TaxID=331696 RepID=A0A345ZUI5_9HYPH|nr:leucyl/phenylalanyl-tRNA--protein transferase [Pseudolabrys taiwanensis]AXK80582.1 leucyl/phenylalanyl-tRNA--protein transferase [Pseudolabrys taiwanensis]